MTALLAAGVAASLFAGCQRVSHSEARRLVQRYNDVVSEAYRRGDAELAVPVVGPEEARKLTGLIGVRLDMGITMDSRLLALEVAEVERQRETLRVRTREQWRYRDLKIGTGEPAGAEQTASYDMLYRFTRRNGEWIMDEIRYATPPQVSGPTQAWAADARTLHAMAPAASNREAGKQP